MKRTFIFRPVVNQRFNTLTGPVGVEHAWLTTEASSAADAIQDYHTHNLRAPWSHAVRVPVAGASPEQHEHVHFAAFEVKGVGNLVSRVYEARIERRGGVRRRDQPTVAERLAQIAVALEWSHPVEELLVQDGPWEGEETEWK